MSGIYAKKLPLKETVNGKNSDYNGVHKPIVYEFIRGDVEASGTATVLADGGKSTITSNDTVDFSELEVDDFVEIIKYSVVNGLYVINQRIITKVLDVISSTQIKVNFGFTTPYSCLVNIKKRENWFLNLTIKGVKPEELTSSNIAVLKIQEKDAVITFNVAPFLRSLVKMNDNFDYNNIAVSTNAKDVSHIYQLLLSTEWNGGISTDVTGYNTSEFYKYINGVKQINEKYGNNFADFYLAGNNLWISKLFNGLEDFDKFGESGTLNYYKGYPISFGFIANEIPTFFLRLFIEEKDINGNNLTTNFYTIDANDRYQISAIKDSMITNNGTKRINLFLRYLSSEDITQYQSTYKYKYDIIDYCNKNTVYLNWLHPTGARMYYLFQKNNIKGIATKTKEVYNPYFEDIENQTGDTFITGKDVTPNLIVGGVESVEKYKWLKTLLYSTNVLMLLNPKTWKTEGAKWQNVNIPDGSFTLEQATDNTFEFSFNIVLPKINTQSE
jgi:hypothetical protein